MQKLLLSVLLSILLCGVAYSQRSVSGKVVEPDGSGLPGVSILVKGASIGTTTNAQGGYSLEVPENAETLVFSFIGFVTREEPIGTRSVIDVTLTEDVKSLDEIVVVGYGTSTTREVTGAVSSVKGDDLIALNPTRIDQALQGQVSGVQISSASGSPGGSLNIRIRGLATNGDNAPLIIVDGVIFSAEGLNSLNPSDVESIDVLKDANAAIYGVLGGNGVIFITTKKGKRNTKTSIEFSGYYGVQETAKKLDLLNAREYAILKNEGFAAGGQAPPFANVNVGQGTDWQDEVFRRAPIQNYSLNINGGTERSTYSFGGSFLDQEGIVGGDKASFRRYNARINYTLDLSSKITLENLLFYTNERRHTLSENGIASVLYNTLNASPLATVKDANGKYTYLEEVSDIINPLAQIANTFNQADVNKIVGKQELTYSIDNHFTLSGRAGYSYAIVDDKVFSPLVYYGLGKAQNTALNENLDPKTTEIAPGVEIPVHNRVQEQRTTYFDYNLEAFLNYNRTFGPHMVKGTLGTAISRMAGSNLEGTAYNIPYNANKFADIALGDGTNLLNSTSSYQFESRLLSYFLRGEYSYNERYQLTAIIRRDASTRFGKNNRFGYFPSISGGWIVSEEPFFGSQFIQFLKLRASYGVLGSDRFENFQYRALLNGEGVYPFNDQLTNGVAIGTLGNPDLKWETTHQTNIGAQLTLLNGNVNVNADYYIKSTNDLLFQPDVSAILGAYGAAGNAPYVNAGDVRNTGFEFLVSYHNELSKDFSFNVSYNLTTVKNEVRALPKGVDFYEYASFGVGGGTATRMEVGYPIGYFFGYKTDGVYQSDAEVAERGITQEGAKAGDLRFVDKDNSGGISFSDDSDKMMLGSAIPDVTMGLSLGANFKGFDFSVLFYSSIGNEILRNYERQQPLANMLDYKIERWTGANSTNEHPRLTTSLNTNAVLSDYFIEDGSFVRIKNIQLGYTLPASIIEKIKATRLRVYVAANNLATFTRYKGYDPDFSSGNPLESGIDYGFYPQARVFMAGLNLNF